MLLEVTPWALLWPVWRSSPPMKPPTSSFMACTGSSTSSEADVSVSPPRLDLWRRGGGRCQGGYHS